jgi:hypothetical protein
MPKLSEFYGIEISMWPDDHGVSHFHARYEGRSVSVAIESLQVLAGGMRPRALALVMEWAFSHRRELRAAWKVLRAGGRAKKIKPLK